jgi:hypothetical protein
MFHEGRQMDGQTNRKKGRQTDRRTDTTKLIAAFCKFANALSNDVTRTGLRRKR